jgi:hypothetical protein
MYHTVVITEGKKKGKPVKRFDPRIRVSGRGGVRYKWTFLAKCHVQLKGVYPYEVADGRSGCFGSYGCIFCCAEGKYRGWIESGKDGSSNMLSQRGSSASVKSGHTANSAAQVSKGETNQTPIFGNIISFMEHLEQVHCTENGWPNAEMQGRFNVVVGRIPREDEDGWEVNFVPPRQAV